MMEGEKMINIKSDSRKIKKGDIFVALKGINTNGEDYIDEAIFNGASKIVVEDNKLYSAYESNAEKYFSGTKHSGDIIIEDSSIYAPEASQGAFFAGQVSGTSTFTNVTVKDSDIYAGRKSGLLVGYAHGIISTTNVTLSGCNVYSTQGEAGILVGVLERGGIPSNKNVLTYTNTTNV